MNYFLCGGSIDALIANGTVMEKTRTQNITISTIGTSSVTFDFPNKILGLKSVSSSNGNAVRMYSTGIGTNSASATIGCDGENVNTTMTYVAIGY